MQRMKYKRLSVIVSVRPHPVTVLFITPLEVADPVAEGLKSVRCQLFPNGGNVTIKKGSSNLIQLTAHTHLTSQGLWAERIRTNLSLCEAQSKRNTRLLSQYLVVLCPAFSPSEAQPESAACGPLVC